jgi:hypothetical protein
MPQAVEHGRIGRVHWEVGAGDVRSIGDVIPGVCRRGRPTPKKLFSWDFFIISEIDCFPQMKNSAMGRTFQS